MDSKGYLLTGQSGARAQRTAGIPPNPYISDPASSARVRIWNPNVTPAPSAFEELTPRVNSDPTEHGDAWGIELQISVASRALFPKDDLYWVKVSPGQCPITQTANLDDPDWNFRSDPHIGAAGTIAAGSPTKWFSELYNQVTTARSMLAINSLKRILFWDTHFHQGEESDCLTWDSVNRLPNDLPRWFRYVHEICQAPNMAIVLVQTHINSLAHIDTSTDAFNRVRAVQQTQQAFVASYPRARLVNQDDLLMVAGHLEYTQIDTLAGRCWSARQAIGV